MNRPYVVCHMMASLDGRIDCDMTEQIGSDGYYKSLAELNIDTSIEGKGTAVKHYAEPCAFQPADTTLVGKTDFYKSHGGNHWEAICDTRGTLRYPDSDTKDRLVLTCERASKEYLNYLKTREISYIVLL
jgi:2,5-diamino-6-(ribosylamino)-4(3H)-pyrimidinone 5'-phosphate reductase